MSILTVTIQGLKYKVRKLKSISKNLLVFTGKACLTLFSFSLLASLLSCQPQEDVVLRRIKDVIVDASSEPMLKANAVLYNPNSTKMKLRRIDIEVFVNGKSSATVDQRINMRIPSKSEFTIPLEVKLNMKELGLLNTLFNMMGGKRMKIRYKGFVSISYKGVPVRVPIDYEDEINLRF